MDFVSKSLFRMSRRIPVYFPAMLIAVLCSASADDFSTSLAEYGSVKETLNRHLSADASAEEKLEVASQLIKCQVYPGSEAEFRSTLDHLSEQSSAGRIHPYIVESFKKNAPRCVGLEPSDFFQVEKLLREAAEVGNTNAQLNYYVYASPQDSARRLLSNPDISRKEIAANSIRYLDAASRKGESQALLRLAEIYSSGNLVTRESDTSAAYLRAFEICTGQELSGEYESIYLQIAGRESSVAQAAQRIARDSCGG